MQTNGLSKKEKKEIKDKIPHKIDKGILAAVEILIYYGFKTIESCQGGKRHAYPDPMIKFEGSEFDLIKAYEICLAYNLNVVEARRIYSKCTDIIKRNDWRNPIGRTYETPANEIVFAISDVTKTIFSVH